MLSLFRYAIYAIVGVLLLAMALNNQQMVEFVVTPDFVPVVGGIAFELPLFMIVLVTLLLGLILGYALEYLREAKIRRQASRAKKQLKKATNELESLKKETGKHDDDVLAILK